METLIGIDLGGTNVRVGVVTPAGKVLTSADALIQAARGPQYGLERIITLIEQVLTLVPEANLRAIGIGATGPVDRARGSIQNPYTLPTWEDVDIVGPLSARFGVPVDLENDADAAALGEAWIGAGRGYSRVAAVTVGTGIGYALVTDQAIEYGVDGAHAEGGHVLIDPHGPPCYCGGRGCLESLAAGPAIAARAQQAASGNATAMIQLAGSLEAIDARVVVQSARGGDALACKLVAEVAEWLGLGIVNILTLRLPDCVCLGGGVMQAYDLFAPGIAAVVARHSIVIPAERVKILPMQLGGLAGVIGAARAAWNKDQERNS
jgi:glucokinase